MKAVEHKLSFRKSSFPTSLNNRLLLFRNHINQKRKYNEKIFILGCGLYLRFCSWGTTVEIQQQGKL